MFIIVSANVVITTKYHIILKKTGGTEYLSSKMYDVADYLKENKMNNLLYFDTHFKHNLLFFSEGLIEGENICDFMNAECGKEILIKLNEGILNKHSYYLISNAQWIFLPWIYNILAGFLVKTNQTVVYNKIFYDYKGEPLYYLLELQNKSKLYSNEQIFPSLKQGHINSIKAYPSENSKILFSKVLLDKTDTLKVKYYISPPKNKVYIFIHKVFEKIFGFDRDSGFIWFYKDYYYLNISNYSSLNFNIISDNQTSGLEFQIREHDGDAWYYFDNTSLSRTNWTIINIPYLNFSNPSWADHGDGKKTFDNIVQIGITVTSFDKAVNKTVIFRTYDDQIFFLE
jgi:hypothetical protein